MSIKDRLISKKLIKNKIAAVLLITISIIAIKHVPSAAAFPVFFSAILAPFLIFAKDNCIGGSCE